MNTPTPETDAAELTRSGWVQHIVPTEFARKLERERDEARQQIHDWIISDKRTAELNHLRKVADELADSLLNCSPMEHYPSESWSRHSEKRGAALAAYNELPHVKKS